MEEPDFWLDPEKSTKIVQEMKSLKNSVDTIRSLEAQFEDVETLLEMGDEENDLSLQP